MTLTTIRPLMRLILKVLQVLHGPNSWTIFEIDYDDPLLSRFDRTLTLAVYDQVVFFCVKKATRNHVYEAGNVLAELMIKHPEARVEAINILSALALTPTCPLEIVKTSKRGRDQYALR